MNKFVEIYIKIGTVLWQLMLLNTLWIIFTLLGLGIFGFFPATIAMFEMIKKIHDNRSSNILKEFYLSYKANFREANQFGFVIVFLFYLIVVLLNALTYYPTEFSLFLRFGLLIGLGLLLFSTMYHFTFFVNIRFKNPIDTLRIPFILSIKQFFWNVSLTISILLINYIIFLISGGILFFLGISLNGTLIYLGTYRSFKKFRIVSQL